MSTVKRVLSSAGIVLLALALLFGCARLFWNQPGQTGWYIQLNIGNPAAKTIGVDEYDVTEVYVEIYAPGESLPFYTVTWYAQDDPLSELIPVSEEGQYRIDVTHIGDNNGDPVEAKESDSFNIQVMVITVINITPGLIGTINITPGDEEQFGQGGVISGRVFDCITGEGISGATVMYGGYSDTTGALGGYSIDVEESVSSVSGVFAVFKGLEYTFRVCGGMSLDPTTDPVYDISLYPLDTTGYTERNLSGKVYDSTGTEIGDGCSVSFSIYNENGGYSGNIGEIFYDQSGGTGYSDSCLTFGSDCLVVVGVDDEFGDPLFSYYLTGQDLSADRANFDLTEPSSGYTDVTVNGTLGTMFQGYLLAPSGGLVYGDAAGDLSGSSQASVVVYNPSNFPMMWWTQTEDENTPGPGDDTTRINAQQMAFASTITLPAPMTAAGPTETVDGATASWNGNTLSFDSAAGADGYIVYLEDNIGYGGIVWLTSSSVTLPSEFVTTVLESGTGWDMEVMSMAGPDFAPEEILGLVIYSDISEGGIPYTEFQLVMVSSASVIDIIP